MINTDAVLINVMTQGSRGTKNHTTNGKAAAVRVDPSEMRRDSATITTKMITATRTDGGLNLRNDPSAVATPLPPRNRSQTGNMWPMMATRADAAIVR